jgi:hypothetical protein
MVLDAANCVVVIARAVLGLIGHRPLTVGAQPLVEFWAIRAGRRQGSSSRVEPALMFVAMIG